MADQVVKYVLSLVDLFTPVINKADKAVDKFEGTLDKVQRKASQVGKALGLAFGAYEMIKFGKDVIETGAKIETLNNVINFSALNAQDAAADHAFLDRIITDMKLPLIETTEGFSMFSAGLIGTSLQGQKAREIFEGVSTAVTAMHVPAEKTESVFRALTEMMAKGTVQSQEMKLQLANALPGAMKLAARSMGMTTAEFAKMMQEGKIMSEDFLPRFAATLKEEFGGAIPIAVQATSARITELNNETVKLKDQLYQDFQPVINESLGLLSSFVRTIKDGLVALAPYKDTILSIAQGFGIAAVAIGGYMVASNLATIATWALNAALLANPLSWVLVGLGLIVTALVEAYKTVDWFRGGVLGLWEALKETGDIVWQFFRGLDNVLEGVLGGGFDQIKLGLDQMETSMFASGARISNAFTKGYQQGMDELNQGGPLVTPPDIQGPVHELGGAFGALSPDKAIATAIKASGKGGKPTNTKSQTKGAQGQKSTTITINIGNLVREMQIQTTNITEGAAKVREMVAQALISATNDSQIIIGR